MVLLMEKNIMTDLYLLIYPTRVLTTGFHNTTSVLIQSGIKDLNIDLLYSICD